MAKEDGRRPQGTRHTAVRYRGGSYLYAVCRHSRVWQREATLAREFRSTERRRSYPRNLVTTGVARTLPTTKEHTLPKITLAQYQEIAAATAQPEAYNHDYLIPGIVGEVGELFGQTAKAVWHGWSASKLEEELVSEYGDVAWMTATLLQMEGITETGEFTTRDDLSPAHILLMRSTALHMYHDRDMTEYVPEAAVRVWEALAHHSKAITGKDFSEVLMYNREKLADRAARNVLRGSGDHR